MTKSESTAAPRITLSRVVRPRAAHGRCHSLRLKTKKAAPSPFSSATSLATTFVNNSRPCYVISKSWPDKSPKTHSAFRDWIVSFCTFPRTIASVPFIMFSPSSEQKLFFGRGLKKNLVLKFESKSSLSCQTYERNVLRKFVHL